MLMTRDQLNGKLNRFNELTSFRSLVLLVKAAQSCTLCCSSPFNSDLLWFQGLFVCLFVLGNEQKKARVFIWWAEGRLW